MLTVGRVEPPGTEQTKKPQKREKPRESGNGFLNVLSEKLTAESEREKMSKRKTKWALLELAAICGLIFISPAFLWTMPLWLGAMIACLIRGELWEVSDDAKNR